MKSREEHWWSLSLAFGRAVLFVERSDAVEAIAWLISLADNTSYDFLALASLST
jgi:hypothetical protein